MTRQITNLQIIICQMSLSVENVAGYILNKGLFMYGKHFASTYMGSMVGSGVYVFAVWGYVIANTIKGRVELNSTLLATILGCKKEQIIKAIEHLCSPDPKSRNKDNDGIRLIKEGEYQYFVTGYEKYHNILNEDERREYNKIKQQEYRKKTSVKEDVNDSQ